jgi:hypothetical protein
MWWQILLTVAGPSLTLASLPLREYKHLLLFLQAV